mmetsp:Transcript_8227/g.28868  ORF Transcript_8227/g.28868 Transcript_8227/m.28868 type:complete len:246 (+) Transcript_8227:478-1215(+)
MLAAYLRSLPSRVNLPSTSTWRTTTLRSPGSPSRMGSPSSKKLISCPSRIPGSTSTVMVSTSRTNLTLGQSSHTFCAYCWYIPGPTCRVTIFCLQLHFRVPFAGLITSLSRVTCSVRPTYRSLSVASTKTRTSLPRGVSASSSWPPKRNPNGPPPPPKNCENMSPGPPPPPPCCCCCLSPSSPWRSYTLRFSGSDSTSKALLISVNFFSASASPGFLSGWYFRASLRYDRLIVPSSAPRGTPSTL